ncbi:MAG: hypothetical protein HFJ58_04675 [Clostridia bacterium]|nr:hypothetical protein [Clostridia bacterium]
MSEIKEILNQDLNKGEEEKIIEELEENKLKVEDKEENNKTDNVTILEQTEKTMEKIDEPENETSKINKKTKVDFLHKYTIAITVISILLFIGLIVFSTVFALINRNSDKIVNGVYINDIDVSELNIEEAKEKLMRNISKQIK